MADSSATNLAARGSWLGLDVINPATLTSPQVFCSMQLHCPYIRDNNGLITLRV
ncbi:MAG TPA: hypothetical protein PLW39_09680 [Thermoflexales bacterium]|nr:hypothetical protein [Thermoflexales bacterium]HQW35362.1 hypothetical protein [Thermoflexales bacterium]HQZ22523.1 hypothetical protein [Thermoflexales bacterium]